MKERINAMRELESNSVNLIGRITGNLDFSHEVNGEKFYKAYMAVERMSDKIDTIPLTISDRILKPDESYDGKVAEIAGQFRSFNKHVGDRKVTSLFVFVKSINFIDGEFDKATNNKIHLEGHICKQPIYRKTPMNREVTDVILAVNRSYGKTDYIPCIAWGRNATFVSKMAVGDSMVLDGRIQSREYTKKISDTEFETRTAVEVSISRIEEDSNGTES